MATALYSRFKPIPGTNQIVDTTGGPTSITVDGGMKTVRACNVGTNLAFVRLGIGAITATSADMPLAGGESIVLHKAWGDNTIACRHAVLPTVLHFQLGDGD